MSCVFKRRIIVFESKNYNQSVEALMSSLAVLVHGACSEPLLLCARFQVDERCSLETMQYP